MCGKHFQKISLSSGFRVFLVIRYECYDDDDDDDDDDNEDFPFALYYANI